MTQYKNLFASLFSVFVLLGMVIYGLIVRPFLLEQTALPLEVVFLLSSIIVVTQALYLGFTWNEIITTVVERISKALPIVMLLFAIGILIGTWVLSGTIPYLVYLSLELVSPEHIYLIAFIASAAFSLCCGSSWGTIATIGLVFITTGKILNVDLGILTGAIVGGAYFGDKLSPLSDTTNVAAISVNVDVQAHIKAMLITTLPAAIVSCILFFILGYLYPADMGVSNLYALDELKEILPNIFSFNYLLFLPPLIILVGSIKKKEPLPTLIVSSLLASLLAIFYQNSSFDDVVNTIHRGFSIDMLAAAPTTQQVFLGNLLNRGGIYSLIEPIVIILIVFIYVGTISKLNAIPTLINKIIPKIKNPSKLVSITLISSGLTNALTSSQYANSFIVGEAFSRKYDELNIPRTVLSRSLEDTGTMIESLIPWSTTSVFIFTSLGVGVLEYWNWQFLSIINIFLAFTFAYLGIGYAKSRSDLEIDNE